MASVIHFKFRSALALETLNFDGDYLSLIDLKRLIAKKKGLLNAADIDFSISNKQTGEVYAEDNALVPKNTEVLVTKMNAKPQLEALRTNAAITSSGSNTQRPISAQSASDAPALPFSSSSVDSDGNKNKDGMDDDALIRQVIEEQNNEWQRKQQERRQNNFPPNNQKFAPGGMGGKPPAHYVCNRCDKPGHWKRDCPTLGDPAFDERKFAVGVPICRTRVLLDQTGATAGGDVMRLPDGRLVQCVPADADFEKAMGAGKQMVYVPPDGSLPKELQCAITKDLAENAHILPCCQSNVSLDVVTPILEDRGSCPICLQPDITVEMLKPNVRLGETVRIFLRTAQERGIRLKRPGRSEAESAKKPDGDEKKSQEKETPALPTGDAVKKSSPAREESKVEVGERKTETGNNDGEPLDAAAGGMREGQGRPRRSGQRKSRRKRNGGGGGSGLAGMGPMGAGFQGAIGGRSSPFFGGPVGYNAVGMPLMNRGVAGSPFQGGGYGTLRNVAHPMQMYMNPMVGSGLRGIVPQWQGGGRDMMSAGMGMGWDQRREGSYESSRSSRDSRSWSRSGSSRSRSSLSRSRSRSRSRDRGRDNRRDYNRDRREPRSRSRDRDARDRGGGRGREVHSDGEQDGRHRDEDWRRRGRDRGGREDDLGRRDSRDNLGRTARRRRARERARDRDARQRDEVPASGGQDEKRSGGRLGGRLDLGERGRGDQDRGRGTRGEEEGRAAASRRGKELVLQSKAEASRVAAAMATESVDPAVLAERERRFNLRQQQGEVVELKSLHVRLAQEKADKEKQGLERQDKEKQEKLSERERGEKSEKKDRVERTDKGDKERPDERKERGDRQDKSEKSRKTDRAATDRATGDANPSGQQTAEGDSGRGRDREEDDEERGRYSRLYMDAEEQEKPKGRPALQPYRPPVALLSKRAAAAAGGQERGTPTRPASVLERLGTPTSDATVPHASPAPAKASRWLAPDRPGGLKGFHWMYFVSAES